MQPTHQIPVVRIPLAATEHALHILLLLKKQQKKNTQQVKFLNNDLYFLTRSGKII